MLCNYKYLSDTAIAVNLNPVVLNLNSVPMRTWQGKQQHDKIP